MKITRVSTYLTRPANSQDGWSEIKPFLFVCLETDQGLEGWGEAFTLYHREHGIEQTLLSVAKQICMADKISPRLFRDSIAKNIAANHPGFDFSCAVSAIEMALWDLLAQTLNVPLHVLLGGALRTEIPLYANTWTAQEIDIRALVQRCEMLAKQGYQAVKIYPLKFGNAKKAGHCMKTVREAVGDDMAILVDLATPENHWLSLETAREIQAYHPYWFEEPISGEYLDVLAEVRSRCQLRVVSGEKYAGKNHVRDVLKKHAADILNPDIAGCGGILEMLEIAAMAQTQAIYVSPHCWNSMSVSLMAMLHVCAVIPNYELAEMYVEYHAFSQQFFAADVIIDDGVARLGDGCGLGAKMDATVLAKLGSQNSVYR